MVRTLVLFAAAAPLLGCGASMRIAVTTTEASSRLEQVTHSQANEFDPAVSPDAKNLAYEVASSPDSKPHVEVMALKEGVTNAWSAPSIEYSSRDEMGLEPTWMPDGSGIIFVSN